MSGSVGPPISDKQGQTRYFLAIPSRPAGSGARTCQIGLPTPSLEVT